MAAVMNAKPRTIWFTALGAMLLVWSLWALRQHSQPTVEVIGDFHEGTAPAKATAPAPALTPAPAPAPAPAHEPEKASNTATPVANSPTVTVTAERKNQVETDRPLILYAYFETENSRKNFEFFIRHGLHAGADFLFILNGENKAEDILPKEPNINYIKRANDCYDLGAFAEVLLKNDLYKKYKRYITLNASIRGPFLPYWSTGCWSDMYLDRITDTVKLMGMTFNCKPANHVQSMIWATDRVGLEILLFPTEEQTNLTRASLPPLPEGEPVPEMDIAGINSCPHEYWRAVAVEVYSTPLIKAAGYDVDTMMTAFHMSKHYQEECREYKDALYENSYFGTNLHPYDTVFAKANRGTNALTLERLTEWMGGRNYTSYDYCPS